MAGALLGVASRWVDTAAWAPAWAGNVLSPWLVAAWLAGSATRQSRAGAVAGLLLLATTVATYLLLGGQDTQRLLPALAVVAAVAGPALGAAGGIGGRTGAAALGAVLVGEGVLLQLGDRGLGERVLFAGEALAGLAVAARGGGGIGAALAVGMGAVLVGAVIIGAVVFGLTLG